jgi:SAM-dependent methyltransferase
MTTSVDDVLLSLLACPHDGASMAWEGNGRVRCAEGHAFPVTAELPNLVTDAEAEAATADMFGAKWAMYSDEERAALDTLQYRWYDERYGWGNEAGLAAFLADKRTILDAGCGLGRDVARYARLSTAEVVGFDLSSAVAAARDAHNGPRRHFLFADILAPPFRPRTFDFVVADQVIHHTGDTPRAFATLADLVAPGGQIAVYVYRRKALVRELVDTHVRDITTRMSHDEAVALSEDLTELGRELSELNATITLKRGVPLLGIAPGEHDVQRLVYWHFLKCYWNAELGHDQSVRVNLDWYHPPHASRHTPEEVRGWCAAAGLRVVHLDIADSGISVRAERPQ